MTEWNVNSNGVSLVFDENIPTVKLQKCIFTNKIDRRFVHAWIHYLWIEFYNELASAN